jgi:hypothetical protein
MSKFNKKSEGVKPTEINEMGAAAFKLNDKEELVSTVMTTFLHDSYYEKEREIVNRIIDKLDKVDPLFAAKLAIYARNDGNMRSVTHLIAAYIVRSAAGTEWAKRFYNKIVVRPDDMSEILSCYGNLNEMELTNKSLRKIPNAIKKGFKEALERLDAYQIDKYKMNSRQVKLIDLVNLLHPTPTQKNEEAYKRLMNGESLAGLYESKVLEKEMSKAGQTAKTTEEKREAKQEAISAVLDNVKGMPIFNLLRNLRNIILYAPNRVDDAIEQLTTKQKVLNSRLLPFRFATAYEEIEKMSYNGKTPSTSIAFESDIDSVTVSRDEFNSIKTKVLDAIEKALEYSCENIPDLEGNTAILIDDSGSMRGDAGGSSRVSAFSNTNSSMIGHLFGSMFAWKQKDVYVGLFGDRLIPVRVDRSKRMLDFNKWSYQEGAKCGGATEAGIYEFLRQCIKEKKKVDNVIVFSDCQIGDGAQTSWYGHNSGSEHSAGFQELFKEFKKINPMCNFVVCNIRQVKGNSVFHKSQRILNIAGWSDKIFDLITSNCKGFDAMIKEIEAIEI